MHNFFKMNKKAMEMSISTVITLIIVIIVLVVIVMIFTRTSNPIFNIFSDQAKAAAQSIPK